MTDKKAYVVIGCAGQYEDHDEWPAAVYLTREDAESHKERAYEWIENHWSNRPANLGNGHYARLMEYNRDYSNPYDTRSSAPYDNSFDYFVVEVPFYE